MTKKENMWFVKENDHTVVASKIFNEEEAIETAKEIHEQHCGRYHEVIRFDLRTGRMSSVQIFGPREYPWINRGVWQ